MTKTLLLAATLLTLTATPAQAIRPPRTVDYTIPAIIQLTVGHPITVTVTPGEGSWGGSASPGSPHLSIGRDAYRDAQHGGTQGLEVLLHEIGHTTGIENEHAADCYALDHLKHTLTELWHRTRGQAQDAHDLAVKLQHGQGAKYGCVR